MTVTTTPETEATIYALIGHTEGLYKCDYSEAHRQAETKLSDESKIRVRQTTRDSVVTNQLTIKNKVSVTKLAKTVKETTCDIPEEMFTTFFDSADKQYVKTRYVFKDNKSFARIENSQDIINLPALSYEVDVFTNQTGVDSKWCKIDVELDAALAYLDANYPDAKAKIIFNVSGLPFNPQQPFEKRDCTEEQSKLLEQIYATQFKY